MDFRQNVSARGQPKIDKLPYDFPRCLCVRESAECNESSHPLGRIERFAKPDLLGPTDPPAAHYDLTFVNDRGLSRRNGSLRLVQSIPRAIIVALRQCRACTSHAAAALDRYIGSLFF